MFKFKTLLLLSLSFCFLSADDNPLVPFKTAFDYFSAAEPDIPSTSRLYEPTADKVSPATFSFLKSDNGLAYYDVGSGIFKLSDPVKKMIYTNDDRKDVPRFSFVSGNSFYSYEYALPAVYTFKNGVDYYTLDKSKIPGGIHFDTFKSAVYTSYSIVTTLKSCPEGSNFNTSTEQCQVCLSGEIWDKSQNKCITGCPTGSVYNPEKKICDEIICAAPEVLDPNTNTCKPCGKGEKYNPESKSCVCQDGFFSYDNRCIETCADFKVLQQRFSCLCSHGDGDKKIKVNASSGKVSGKFEGFYDKNDIIVGVNQNPDTIVANYACVAKCTVGIIRVALGDAGNAMCSGLNLDDFTSIDLDTLDKNSADLDGAKTDKNKDKDKDKDKGDSGKGDGKGDGSNSGDNNSGGGGNANIGDKDNTKTPDKPGSDNSKDKPDNNGKGKDNGSKGDKGNGGGGNKEGLDISNVDLGIGDSDNTDYFAEFDDIISKGDSIMNDFKELSNFLSTGNAIAKLNSPSVPKSCPVTRKFSGTHITAKDVTWDLCAVLAPMRDPLYFMFYLAFFVSFAWCAYKILLNTFKGI